MADKIQECILLEVDKPSPEHYGRSQQDNASYLPLMLFRFNYSSLLVSFILLTLRNIEQTTGAYEVRL